jgi:16S rRNA processing protein RimM
LEPEPHGEWAGVGEVLTTHGVQGELRVLPLTDDLSRWEELSRVYCRTASETMELHIESVRYHKQCVIVKFKEIPDITAAERLKDCWLWLPKYERKPLPAGRFYRDQLLGLEVLDDTERFIGRIRDILQTGANDVLVVGETSKEEILLPAIKSVILAVDLENGKMRVKIPPGLLEDDTW